MKNGRSVVPEAAAPARAREDLADVLVVVRVCVCVFIYIYIYIYVYVCTSILHICI